MLLRAALRSSFSSAKSSSAASAMMVRTKTRDPPGGRFIRIMKKNHQQGARITTTTITTTIAPSSPPATLMLPPKQQLQQPPPPIRHCRCSAWGVVVASHHESGTKIQQPRGGCAQRPRRMPPQQAVIDVDVAPRGRLVLLLFDHIQWWGLPPQPHHHHQQHRGFRGTTAAGAAASQQKPSGSSSSVSRGNGAAAAAVPAGPAAKDGAGLGGPTTPAPPPPTASSTSSSSSSTPPPSSSSTTPSSSVLSSALVGDQMTVISVAVLTLLLLLSPALVDRIRNREHYDDFFNFDDPIDDLTLELYRLSRDECEQQDTNNGTKDDEGNDPKAATANGPRQKNVVENLLRDVFQSAALQEAAEQFVVTTLQSEPVRAALQRLLKELAMDLLQDPETIAQVVQLLNVAIQNDQVRRAAQQLVIDLVNDPDVKASLVSVIQRLGQDTAVQEASQQLLTDTAHAVLNDEDVMDHSMEFATDVLGDDVVQQTAGEALRNTVGHAVRPAATTAVWGAAGLAWMAVALFALSYANHRPNSARTTGSSGWGGGGSSTSTDRALTGIDRAITVGTGTDTSRNGGLISVVTKIPGHILSMLTWPIRRVGSALIQPLAALGRTIQGGTASAVSWVASLPSRVVPCRDSWFRLPGIVASAVLGPIYALGRVVGSSFSYVLSGAESWLSAATRHVAGSLRAGATTAGARALHASSNLWVGLMDVLRTAARATRSRGSEFASWTARQLVQSWSHAVTRASTALATMLRPLGTYQPGYGGVWEAWTRPINDALTDWSLAAEQYIASYMRR